MSTVDDILQFSIATTKLDAAGLFDLLAFSQQDLHSRIVDRIDGCARLFLLVSGQGTLFALVVTFPLGFITTLPGSLLLGGFFRRPLLF